MDIEKKCDLNVRVSPNSKRNRISQVSPDGMVKINLTSPPVEGKANIALIRYLSTVLDISQSNISIIRGEKIRNKLVRIVGIELKDAYQRLSSFCDG